MEGGGTDGRHESCTAVPTCTEPFPGERRREREKKKEGKNVPRFTWILFCRHHNIIKRQNQTSNDSARTPPPNCDPRPIRYDTNSWALSHLDPSPSHKLAENQGPRPPVLPYSSGQVQVPRFSSVQLRYPITTYSYRQKASSLSVTFTFSSHLRTSYLLPEPG